jgi:hypothetical protein
LSTLNLYPFYSITEHHIHLLPINLWKKHNLPMSLMKTPLLVSSPGGEMKVSHICPRVNLKLNEIEFLADLVVLKFWGIDVILGMDWLRKHDGVIQCRKR